jgi:hypothetical protein
MATLMASKSKRHFGATTGLGRPGMAGGVALTGS